MRVRVARRDAHFLRLLLESAAAATAADVVVLVLFGGELASVDIAAHARVAADGADGDAHVAAEADLITRREGLDRVLGVEHNLGTIQWG